MKPERQREIEALADLVRKEYAESDRVNWDRLADDRNIVYLENPRFFIPIAMLTTNGLSIVAVSTLRQATYGMDHRAHEFGHVLLGHLNPKSRLTQREEEEEATHFAYTLIGKVENDYSSTLLQRILAEVRYPVASIKSVSDDRAEWSEYVMSYIRGEAKKELRRRVRIEKAA